MPIQVPVAPTVSQQPSAPIRQPNLYRGEGAEAAAVGEGLQRAVPAVDKLEDAFDRERVNAEMQALAEWKRINVDHFETGALAKLGVTAKGVADDVSKRYREMGERIRSNLANSRQRSYFERAFQRDYEALSAAVTTHESRQLAAAGKLGYEGRVEDIKNTAARAIALGGAINTKSFLDARNALAEEVAGRQPVAGWDADAASLELRAQQTDFHARVLAALTSPAQRRYEEAHRYLEAARPEMDSAVADGWASKIKQAGAVETKAQMAASVWQTARGQAVDPVTKRFSREKAYAVLETFAPEVRDAVRSDFDREVTLMLNIQREEDAQRLSRLSHSIRQANRLDENLPDFINLDDEGKEAARRMVETRHRQNRQDDVSARREQADLDSIAKSQFRELAPEIAADLTNEQIDAQWGDMASDKMLAKLKGEERQRARHYRDNNLTTHYGQFRRQVMDHYRQIEAVYGADRAREFADLAQDWYAQESKDGRAPEPAKVDEMFGKQLVLYDIPFGSGGFNAEGQYTLDSRDKFGFELGANVDRYKPAKEQPFAIADRGVMPTQPPGISPAQKQPTTRTMNGKIEYRVRRGGKLGWTDKIIPGDEVL